ncbi:MAG: hypothetical protein ACTHLZ_03290 [Tepidisphaeraceae bacterium]
MTDRNPILDVPLSHVLKPQIALCLQQVLRVYTVGNLLELWQDPRDQRRIEQLFDAPDQARHAISVCAAWLGFDTFIMRKAPSDPWHPGEITLNLPNLRETGELDG